MKTWRLPDIEKLESAKPINHRTNTTKQMKTKKILAVFALPAAAPAARKPGSGMGNRVIAAQFLLIIVILIAIPIPRVLGG